MEFSTHARTFSSIAVVLRGIAIAAAVLAPSLAAQPVPARAAAQDLRGAWRMDDGGLVALHRTDDSDTGWRYIDFGTGESHRLYPRDSMHFVSSDRWNGADPARRTYTLSRDAQGRTVGVTVSAGEQRPRQGTRVAVREDTISFQSGDVTLFGTLVLPATGTGPWPVIVYVHGSDNTASVDRSWEPYLFAANGVAMFVFDKRGTGRSGGRYTQLFTRLADDVVAATARLRSHPDVDTLRIGLAGFSQGGWVAPLAASRDPGIRFLLVGYGMTMSVADEDRLEAPLKLRAQGFTNADIAEFETLNAAIHRAAERHFAEGWGEIDARLTQYRDRPWLRTLPTMQTWAGTILAMGLEQAKRVVPEMFTTFIDPFYDPVPTLRGLDIPVLWMIAEDDIEAPPGPTIATLRQLASEGESITLRIFPGTDHGMTRFATTGTRRIRTRYAREYFDTMVAWARTQVGRSRR